MQIVIFNDILITADRYAGGHRIATALRNKGYEVIVLDWWQSFPRDTLIKIVTKFVTKDTLWVGFASTFAHHYFPQLDREHVFGERDAVAAPTFYLGDRIKSLFGFIKTLNPKTQIIVGGTRTDLFKQYEHKSLGITADWYFFNNSDNSIIAFTDWLAGKGPRPIIINENEIHGVGIYDVPDISHLTIDWHEWDWIQPYEVLPIEIARGCIFKCKFCNYNLTGKKRGEYTKNLDVLVEEMTSNYERFGTQHYYIMDETMNDDMYKVQMLYDLSQRLPFKITFRGFARIDLYHSHSPDMADMMQEAGLCGHFFGIETFNDETGKIVGKGLGGTRLKEAMHKLREHWGPSINISAGFIAGLPKESKESIMETIDWLHDNLGTVYDAAYLFPLGIERFGAVKGPFGENPDKFGYRFPTNNAYYWENDYMTLREAFELSDLYQDRIKDKSKLGIWDIGSWENVNPPAEMDYKNLTLNEAFFTRRSEYYELKSKKVEQYTNFLLSI
jgi:hypothetical protein